MKKAISVIAIIIVSIALFQCSKKNETQINTSHHSQSLTKVFDAHGGYDTWSEMKSLSFSFTNGEHQLIDLNSRKVLIEDGKRTIGFDGKEVWVVPDSLTNGARFYHNLYFYFFAMPFVLGDPGISYEDVGNKELFGMNLHGIKVSYGTGVGDSPKDNYIVYFDEVSKTMKALMYTVTFRTQEPSNKFSLIKYDEWQEISGVLLPKKLQWYNYENDTVGEMRKEAIFIAVSLSKDKPDEKLFTKPEGAGIAIMQ